MSLRANMLGAVVGGLFESLSLIIGMKALLIVAAAMYSLAALGFRGLAARNQHKLARAWGKTSLSSPYALAKRT
ncbi:MAG TPA: hypothetical protein VIH78_06780 [Terriglobales bacterium]